MKGRSRDATMAVLLLTFSVIVNLAFVCCFSYEKRARYSRQTWKGTSSPTALFGHRSQRKNGKMRNETCTWDVDRRDFMHWSSASAIGLAMTTSPAQAKTTRSPFPTATRNPDVPTSPSSSIPFSSVRSYRSITLSNGLPVLLVSDARAKIASAALSLRGAGQFSDPPGLSGCAHLMEHMILSKTFAYKRKEDIDFEDWLANYDGASNGFTAYEKVCFHFTCPSEVFGEALQRFASLFLPRVVERTCRDKETLRREILRVDSELDFSSVASQELYLLKSLLNQQHPYSRFSAGSMETLDKIPSANGVDVGEALIDFFHAKYLPSRGVLVVISPADLSTLEFLVSPFASVLARGSRMVRGKFRRRNPEFVANNDDEANYFQRQFPNPFPEQNSIRPICLFRSNADTERGENYEVLSFQWPLSLDYSDLSVASTKRSVTAGNIGFCLSQILARKGPGSLYQLLKTRNWVPEGTLGIPRISFPVDVPGFQILKLELRLTTDGFVSRNAVIAAVYDAINSLRSGPMIVAPFVLKRELVTEYATSAQLYGFTLAPRPPDAIELAFDGQLYGVSGSRGISNPEWKRFPPPTDFWGIVSIQKALSQALELMSDPTEAIIIVTASKPSILATQSNLFDTSLPELSPASWNIAPLTGARYYYDDVFRLSGKANEWLVARLMEDELTAPVLNPLVPPNIRPPRLLPDSLSEPNDTMAFKISEGRDLVSRIIKRKQRSGESDEAILSQDLEKSKLSIVKDNWQVLRVLGQDQKFLIPRTPPEASVRSVFILQLLSSRPARANVEMAAYAELWKYSFEYAIADLAELGAPGALGYEISYNKYGLRVSFLGISQNIGSYARRFCRRLVDHSNVLRENPKLISAAVIRSSLRSAELARNLSPKRKKLIMNVLQEASPTQVSNEAAAFFQSCGGGVCVSQGDLLPRETAALLGDLAAIFRTVTGVNVSPAPATPDLKDLLYAPVWMPRSASLCSIAGASHISDACGRVPR